MGKLGGKKEKNTFYHALYMFKLIDCIKRCLDVFLLS